jgi:uncharacterized protein
MPLVSLPSNMPTAPITLDTLRRYAVSRTLFTPTSLTGAITRLGFVQADPIRAPARAQDLTLRHRVKNYRAGDLEQHYPALDIEEDYFVNYGFLPRHIQALMHPRTPREPWTQERTAQAKAVLQYVAERGVVHPREVDSHFAHGRVRNWFGGSTNASTQLLDAMHYRGMLRVADRASGVRRYALPMDPAALHRTPLAPTQALDALIDVIVNKYAPLPERTLRQLISHLRGGVPQWAGMRSAAMGRAKARLASTMIDGIAWYWPADETPTAKRYAAPPSDAVRLLAPFDPLVWDRHRFELLWGWAYRFEAYTPAPKRLRGYYALPLLWRDQVIGWGNLTVKDGTLHTELGYTAGKAPREKAYRSALDDELASTRSFLRLTS